MSNEDEFGAEYGPEPGDCKEYFVAGLHNGAKQERLLVDKQRNDNHSSKSRV
ncbi:hypothetical protein BWQ96_04396 [Gracilariopsis chorda]|uniref:Uncharacterized protein n=1 Tax=Gracilariopsis chorda TaxID=448386 RepID=A0A2V3IUU5_9FLOR|nr:hypothetical protein BWQ96_04396 [Gracilariopsis chorda]|eukprot:PXF45859.1 hypothetical protein BWQ96_04396 [Gracilariopsis chorda]